MPDTITLDLETSGIDPQKDKIILNGYRINETGPVRYAAIDRVDAELQQHLLKPESILRGHNIKFDALFLGFNGYRVDCQLEDTRVMAYTCWPQEDSHGLKYLCRKKLGLQPRDLSSMLFKVLRRDIPYLHGYDDYYVGIDDKLCRLDALREYHQEDIFNVDKLRAIMCPPKWFFDVEMPLTKILYDTELYGSPLDGDILEDLDEKYSEKSERLLDEIKKVKEDINPNSSQQVAKVLLDRGIVLSQTPAGNYSVDKLTLKKLAWKGDEFAKTLLEYRRLSKLLSTYIKPFIESSKADGRLHGSFNQAGSEDIYGDGSRGTNTGRLSSSSPNLQNIPARTEEGKKIRKAFIHTKEWFQFNSDLKQIEPRLIAHESQSKKLLNAYNRNLDTHALFAADIYSKPTDSLSTTERFIGKTSWLATTYGCSPAKLYYICQLFSESPLELSLSECDCSRLCESKQVHYFKKVQDNFRAKNPEIMAWTQTQVHKTRVLGFVKTIGGRRIPLPDINSPIKPLRFAAERKAINTPIQGSCADIIKLIIIRLDKELIRPGNMRLFTTVHDEINGELKHPDLIHKVKEIMDTTVQLNGVKVDSDTKLVNNWGDKK